LDFAYWVRGVSYSSGLKWFVVGLVPLTLAWKLVAGPENVYELKNDLVAFLLRHNFDVIEQTIIDDMPVIHAEMGACQIVMVEASPEGWSQDVFRQAARSMDHQFIVFRGTVYAEQPTWLTATADWWSNYLHRLGIAQLRMHVIAVAETHDCDAERLPWADLSADGGIKGSK
jgi:hypothetical protein